MHLPGARGAVLWNGAVTATRFASLCALLPGLLLAGGAARAQMGSDGYFHTRQNSGTIPCPSAPLSLDGNHSNLSVAGYCSRIRVTGEHNDITADIVAGGTIDIVGQHNDVTWRQVTRGPAPALNILAPHNDFHQGH